MSQNVVKGLHVMHSEVVLNNPDTRGAEKMQPFPGNDPGQKLIHTARRHSETCYGRAQAGHKRQNITLAGTVLRKVFNKIFTKHKASQPGPCKMGLDPSDLTTFIFVKVTAKASLCFLKQYTWTACKLWS